MFVQRDENGKVIGVWASAVEGVAEEELKDDHPDVVGFYEQHLNPVPQIISRARTLQGLVKIGLITAEEAEASNVTVPAGVATVFDNMPEPQRTDARILWLNFVEANRQDPLIAALAAANDMSDADIDDFFRMAKQGEQ